MSVALGIQHVVRVRAMLNCRLTPVWMYLIFAHYLIKATIFVKTLLSVKCAF